MNDTAQAGPSNPATPPLVEKVQRAVRKAIAIVTDPKGFWNGAKTETGSVKDFYLEFPVILGALQNICVFLGIAVWGITILHVTFRPPVAQSFFYHLFAFVMQLVGLYIGARVLEFLAPKFGGTTTMPSALRLIAYSMAPSYLAAVLYLLPIFPFTIIAAIFSLYSLYIFWVGVPHMTTVNESRRVGYVISSFVLLLVIFVILMAIVSPLHPKPPANFTVPQDLQRFLNQNAQ